MSEVHVHYESGVEYAPIWNDPISRRVAEERGLILARDARWPGTLLGGRAMRTLEQSRDALVCLPNDENHRRAVESAVRLAALAMNMAAHWERERVGLERARCGGFGNG